ncbi:hypothetical protein ACFO1B_15320 [Dactylosporangium siamense]|uniref:Uncharacterized protein n=1 Tax=Dactylosporangium siamense TaxID=685454 RepID=A0A919UB45_9ACTN|nr:hypothetical protein [Dactylosporangium siamense]GIG45206.1 hypothetical protein Dsi01nite_032470 [Dactylosporangium siamense]
MSGTHVEVDAVHGGRWTSLRGSDGKQWLWRRDAPGRDTVGPGDPFVDVGGIEECYPTISGTPDHGHVWSRPWLPDGDALRVRGDDFDLTRRIEVDGDEIVAGYRLLAPPGQRFIWAAHALLELSTAARVVLAPGTPMIVDLPDDTSVPTAWPALGDTDVSRFGPVDGTVMGVRLPGLTEAAVEDGDSRLTFTVEVEGQPTGFMLWRNLGGWPEPSPYRSTGVEPMIGQRATLANAGPDEAATVPPSGEVTWTLRIRTT